MPFTDNFSDLSNAQGYQFEFRCERCGNGYRSAFQRDAMETGRSMLRAVGSFFGGTLQQLSSSADQWKYDRATNSAAKDRALTAAEEVSRAQAAAQRDQIWDQAREKNWTADLDLDTRAKLTCPGCGLKAEGGKFCTGCGSSLAPTVHCGECGKEAKAGAVFCSDCGHRL